jgi:predicted Zn-dependent peptidase
MRCAGRRSAPTRSAPALALLALLALPLAPRDAGALDDPALRARTHVLENGLRVLTLEDPTTPVVSFQMWVLVGSKDEARVTGLAHLFEHMMFKGSKRIGPEEHARLVQARGGRLNAFTSHDFTVYHSDVPAEALPLVIDLEAERLANLDVSEATLASEREVVLEERRLRTEDQPTGRAFEALFALAFQAHPYRWPVIGWRSDIESATVEECREFFRSYYAPNNVLISIAGDFGADAALDRVRRAFGRIPAAPVIPRNPTREPEQRGERRAVVGFPDLSGPLLAAAWHAPASGHPDAEALDVASEILSGGRSSRLYRRLVYEEAAALAAEGAYWELAASGVFYAFASARPGVPVARVEALLMGEIARLREEPVQERELEKAKRQLEVALVNGLETNHALAARIAQETALFGRVRPLAERLAAIQAVGANDVRRVARAYLSDRSRSVVHVVPPSAGEAP